MVDGAAFKQLAGEVADVLESKLDDETLRGVFKTLEAWWCGPDGMVRQDAPYGAGTFLLALSDVLPVGVAG